MANQFNEAIENNCKAIQSIHSFLTWICDGKAVLPDFPIANSTWSFEYTFKPLIILNLARTINCGLYDYTCGDKYVEE